MKNIVAIVITLLAPYWSYGQAEKKNMDFVILVDKEICIGTISSMKLYIYLNNDSIKTLTPSYYPGCLSMDTSEYKLLTSDNVSKVVLQFNYLQIDNQQSNVLNYKLKLKKSWFKNRYNIIQIYNVDSGPYKNVFEPLGKDMPYTFELFSSGESFTRVRLK